MSIRSIDRYVGAMHRANADELLLEAGQPVRLKAGESTRVLIAQPIPASQISKLVGEILPADQAGRFEQDGEIGFEYAAPTGPVAVRSQRKQAQLFVSIRPATKRSLSPKRPNIADLQAEPAPTLISAKPHDVSAKAPPPPPIPSIPSSGSQAFEDLVDATARMGASDLHLLAGAPPRVRQYGELFALKGFDSPVSGEIIENWLKSPASQSARERFAAFGESTFSHEISKLCRVRVRIFRDHSGVGGTVRIVPLQIPTAEALKIPKGFQEHCLAESGVILIGGAAGSGKSTTLAAIIDLLNHTRLAHIVCIEDPIEYLYASKKALVRQREVNEECPSVVDGLTSALKQDVNVLVAPISDARTAKFALEAASTGRLLIGTVEAHDALGAIERFVSLCGGDEPGAKTRVASNLRAVLSQQLCLRKGGGRVAVFESISCNANVQNLIREGKTYQIPSVIKGSRGVGMQTLSEALAKATKQGLIEAEEAVRRAQDKVELISMLEQAGLDPSFAG